MSWNKSKTSGRTKFSSSDDSLHQKLTEKPQIRAVTSSSPILSYDVRVLGISQEGSVCEKHTSYVGEVLDWSIDQKYTRK